MGDVQSYALKFDYDGISWLHDQILAVSSNYFNALDSLSKLIMMPWRRPDFFKSFQFCIDDLSSSYLLFIFLSFLYFAKTDYAYIL